MLFLVLLLLCCIDDHNDEREILNWFETYFQHELKKFKDLEVFLRDCEFIE